MKRLVYIADFLRGDTNGGAECNDDVLIKNICPPYVDLKIDRKRCSEVTVDYLKLFPDAKYIVSNMVMMMPSVRNYLKENCEYIKYEHDHQYLITRNPADYENYEAPDSDKQYVDFYASAKAVICQSNFHKEIMDRNINANTISVGGNLWTNKELEYLRYLLLNQEKSDKYSITDSDTWHKNTKGAIKLCNTKGWDYELIKSNSWEGFMEQLASHHAHIFLPLTPETLSRVLVEARMLGVKVASVNAGALHEKWFQELSGEDLIDHMHEKRRNICEKVWEVLFE